MQSVYVDLLFLINFSMDFLCFYITAKIRYTRLPYVRTLIAAAIGGTYSVVSLFITDYKAPLCIASLIMMCLFAFYQRGEKFSSIILSLAIYLMSSALLGGIMTAIFNFLNEMELDLAGIGENELPLWLIAVTFAVSVISAKISGRYVTKKASKSTAEILIKINGKDLTLNAIYDSGNLLKDSFSGKPIIIVDERYTTHFFPAFSSLNVDNVERLSSKERALIRIIPCSTVNKSSIMIAVRPTVLQIKTARGKIDADALICFGDLHGVGDGIGALIPTEFI